MSQRWTSYVAIYTVMLAELGSVSQIKAHTLTFTFDLES